jgi:S-adenosyl methyltransferase
MTEAGMGLGRTVAHAARMWNYYLGGKDNYQIDRDVAEAVLAIYPGYGVKARTCRYFLLRAVRFLAVAEGVRQFLDIGTGLPTAENTHEVAQRFAPEARIVYVDNDPLVLAHARSLLTSSPEGVTRFVDADLRDPDRILEEARLWLDFEAPIALLLLGVLGHIPDYEQARSIVRRLLMRCRREAIWCSATGRRPTTRMSRPCRTTRTRSGFPTSHVNPNRSPRISRDSNSSSRVLFRFTGGGPSPGWSAFPVPSTSQVESAASPDSSSAYY